MNIYILLSHEYTDNGELFYQYFDCLTLKDFSKFCRDCKLTYNINQGKLYDYANFERYQVIVKTLDK